MPKVAIRVLIADDNATSRELVRDILESAGYEIVEACDGADALRKIEEKQPDLVLLDIQMPVLDGFQVMQRLRANPQFANLRVAAFTANALTGDRETVLAAGFQDYITKPVKPAILRMRVEKLLH